MIGTKTGRGTKPEALAVGSLMAAAVTTGVRLAARTAPPDTFTVNSTGDARDLFPGNGSCSTGNVLPGPECT